MPKISQLDAVGRSVKKLSLALLVLGLTAPAHADIVMPGPTARPTATIRLTSLTLVNSDAPEVDTERVTREARRALGQRSRRIQHCVAGLDLRRDPLRSGARTLEGRLVFRRSARPTLTLGRVRGFPQPVRVCVEQAIRGIRVGTTPRGTVEVRFAFSIR